MTTQLYLLIITICAVVIIAVLLNKNKKLNQTKLATDNTELISEIQKMTKSNTNNTEVIRFVRQKTGLGLVEAKKYVENIKNK